MSGEMTDPGQDPRGARISTLVNGPRLDTRRLRTTWSPKLEYDSLTTIK
jgi:hypothetical protein